MRIALLVMIACVTMLTATAHAAPPCEDQCATLDLPTLESRLRHTPAIGFLTKVSLKHQVDDLIHHFARFHQGDDTRPLPKLRQRFDGLMAKVVGLLERRDDRLARDVAASREPLWSMLSNPRTFSKLVQTAKSDL